MSRIRQGAVTNINNGDTAFTVVEGLGKCLVVLIGTHQGTISTVTWNGASLTKVGEGASAFNECGDIWALMNPTAGTGNVVISMSGGSWYGGSVLTLYNVKQVAESAIAKSTGTVNSSSPSASITPTTANNLILCAFGGEAIFTSNQEGSFVLDYCSGQSFEGYIGLYFEQAGADARTLQVNVASGQRFGYCIATFEPEPSINIPSFNLVGSFRTSGSSSRV